MKNFRSAVLIFVLLACGRSVHLSAQSKYSRNDPFPLATASNPLGSFTTFYDCDPEFQARFSLSAYEQNADSAGDCAGNASVVIDTPATASSPEIILVNPRPLGNLYGPWNFIGLFYPEANGDTTIQGALSTALHINPSPSSDFTNFWSTDFPDQASFDTCVNQNVRNPSRSDPNKLYGFVDADFVYYKYGARFDADILTPIDLGLRIRLGVAQIRQFPCPGYIDRMPSQATVCPSSTPPTLCTGCRTLVSDGIINQRQTIASLLALDLGPYCASSIDLADIALYWTHPFEINRPAETFDYAAPHATFNPFLVFEFSPPFGKRRPPEKLCVATFNNNGHTAWGMTGGFTFNFLQTVEVGFDLGFTMFSCEAYPNQPVPTNAFEEGIYTRKADFTIRPGTNWSFGACVVAHHFLENFTASVDFRLVQHCLDDIMFQRISLLPGQQPYPASNLLISKLVNQSGWRSCFVDCGLTYDVSENIGLGIFAQLPVRQRFAYRSTTFMGSLIISF